MAGGAYYHDTLPPWIIANQSSVTLSTTAKALYTASAFPYLGPHWFNFAGRKLHIRLYGGITTGATPGNGSFNVYYGTGADANGVAIMTGTPIALSANASNLAWEVDLVVRCNLTGASGTFLCTGTAKFNNAVFASTLQPIMLPTGAPAASSACDLTAANIISVQFLRSGNTSETMQVADGEVTAYN